MMPTHTCLEAKRADLEMCEPILLQIEFADGHSQESRTMFLLRAQSTFGAGLASALINAIGAPIIQSR